MSRRPGEWNWLEWLTVEEAVELHVLNALMRIPRYRSAASSAFDKMRVRACKRRERNPPDFAIYLYTTGGRE